MLGWVVNCIRPAKMITAQLILLVTVYLQGLHAIRAFSICLCVNAVE